MNEFEFRQLRRRRSPDGHTGRAGPDPAKSGCSTSPEDENRIWYRLYEEVETDPAIIHIHREFLFARDYAAFAFLFLFGFGAAGFFLVTSIKVSLAYWAILLLQHLVVRQAAATYGGRFVTTVLARKAAQPAREAPKATKRPELAP